LQQYQQLLQRECPDHLHMKTLGLDTSLEDMEEWAYSGKNKGNVCTNWLTLLNGQTNGKRECARRMRQMKSSG
jgi:hypothetical protein